MAVSMREYRDEDRERVNVIWADAFRRGDPYPPRMTNPSVAYRTFPGDYEDEEAFVAEQDGNIVGGFAIRSTSVTCRGTTLTCGGIAAVAVAAEVRKGGVGKTMMTWAVERMRENGQMIGNLRAAHEIFYRRYGWECCGNQIRVACPLTLFPGLKLEPTLPTRRLSIEDWDPLCPTYEKFANSYSGMALRKSLRWSGMRLTSGGPPCLIAAGDPVEGYAILRPTGGPEQGILEFVWSTPEAYETLLSTFGGVGINHTTVSWTEPSNGPFMSRRLTRGVDAKLDHPSMFRVMDVPGSLRALPASESGSFTLAVDDEILASNRGPWRVSYSPHGVEVEPCDNADVRMDIRQFAQALLGEPSFPELLTNSLVSCASEEPAQAASALLGRKPTYNTELF